MPMKKAYIWAGIWAILILAPLFFVLAAYEPTGGAKVDIVKIGVILPTTASSTAEQIKFGFELLPKRPIGADLPPSIVFIYQDSNGTEQSAVDAASLLITEGGVSALAFAADGTEAALVRMTEEAGLPFIIIDKNEQKFSCEKDGQNNVGVGEAAALKVFCESYQKQYSGKKPEYFAAYAFDVGNILMRALDVQQSDSETKDAIKRAFSSHKYTGITGTIQFDSEGNRI
jgi:ABC-type branched-subunit amino acid transport system substrate-binding protein